jgi:hypothetical protein
MTQSNTRPGYRALSYSDKVKHMERGCIHQAKSNNGWRVEWSAGNRRPSGRMRYHHMTFHGSYESARALLDLIVSEIHRSKEDAVALIAPYIRATAIGGVNEYREIITCDIPKGPLRPQAVRRANIQLDYWRMRLLDTIEAYRRFDDA